MKKVLLLSAVAGMIAFTSCEKERNEAANSIEEGVNATGDAINDGAHATGDAINDGVNATGDALNDVSDATNKAFEDAKALVTDAPNVENDELQEWVNKLHDSAVKAKAYSQVGNQEGLNEVTAEMASLSESLENFHGEAGYAEAQAYYEEVKAEIAGE